MVMLPRVPVVMVQAGVKVPRIVPAPVRAPGSASSTTATPALICHVWLPVGGAAPPQVADADQLPGTLAVLSTILLLLLLHGQRLVIDLSGFGFVFVYYNFNYFFHDKSTTDPSVTLTVP